MLLSYFSLNICLKNYRSNVGINVGHGSNASFRHGGTDLLLRFLTN
jgi:hypothetical protein